MGILAFLTAASVAVYVGFFGFFLFGTRRMLRVDAPARARDEASRADLPGVTMLKPCAGADDDLEECLESYCRVNYPNLQLLFGVHDAEDSAAPVIRRVLSRHPQLDATLVFTGLGRHPSPKISNVDGLSPHVKHDLLWLTDSNTRIHPDALDDMVQSLARPNVGAVVSPVVADGERSVGAALDNLEINAWVTMGTYATFDVSGVCAAPGKSVLFHKNTLEAIGGWDELGNYFGEDTVLLGMVKELGMSHALGRHVVINTNAHTSVKQYLSRQGRWAQIRWKVAPLSMFTEPFQAPVIPAMALLLYERSWLALQVMGAAVLTQVLVDWMVMYRLRGKPMALRYVPLIPLRPFVMLWLIVRGLWGGRITWRRSHAWMGPRSRILSEPPVQPVLRWLRNRRQPALSAERPTTVAAHDPRNPPAS